MKDRDLKLDWSSSDIECRFALKGGKFTAPGALLPFMLGLIFSTCFLGVVYYLYRQDFHIGKMFFERGPVPFPIVLLAGWCLGFIWVKRRKQLFQEQSLNIVVVPTDPSYAITPDTTSTVLDTIYETVDSPRHFILFNRIENALANLKNMGRIGDVDEILKSQAENDENVIESSYTQIKGFIWAIPVLGFIGTVMGLSEAIGSFGAILQNSTEFSQIKGGLQTVTGGLATAFDTTFIALVAALFIQILINWIKQKDEALLDECTEYCMRNVIARLRLQPPEAPVKIKED